ncbi:uncharacterized protein LOC130546663 [Triplophysa rosa]|nr:uncharacterized protein LOC130546663 [Triplophysa rosa]
MDKLIHLILLSGLAYIQGSLEENLALNGTVTQSSTRLTWVAQNAIDGKKYGSEYCSATLNQSNPWWRLDLLDVYNISTVIITAHNDYLDQANGAEIRVGNSLENNGNNNPICAVTSGLQAARTITYSCPGMLGRYVNVFMPGSTAHLSLCEVEVYGTENLASKGTVTQSTTLRNYVVQKAKDGARYGADTCSATLFQTNPWWRLDLLDVYNIGTVIITPRSDCCSRETKGAEIRIGNSLDNNGNNNPRCAVVSQIQVGHTISYSCPGMSGRYVNVFMTGPANWLSLCEVEVYGTENFAFKGTVTQLSTHLTWVAQYAVDGVRYGSVEAEHCSSTSPESNPWWRLDLLDYYEIDTVIIAPKPSCCPEFTTGVEIRIGNSLDNNGNNNPM